MSSTWVVSLHGNASRLHLVEARTEAEFATTAALCGAGPGKLGWRILPLGLDDPHFGKLSSCDRCTTKFNPGRN